MRRILKSVSLVVTFAIAGALSVSPVNATGDEETLPPTLISPTSGGGVNPTLILNYVLGETPGTNSVTVTLTRTSPASPAFTRTMLMSETMNVNLSINAFATPSEIVSQSAGKISAINPSTGVLPVGTYTVRISYQDALANPSTFASSTGITFTVPCAAGTYSTDGNVPVGSDCTQSPANSYVATAGATAPTACLSGYTSPAGSDESSDCIAPVVSETPSTAPATKALPTLAKGKKMKIKTLATQIEMSVPAKSKVTAKVAKSSKKVCKVSGTSIKALKKGNCVVTVKVKPKKGSATTKATTITVN